MDALDNRSLDDELTGILPIHCLTEREREREREMMDRWDNPIYVKESLSVSCSLVEH